MGLIFGISVSRRKGPWAAPGILADKEKRNQDNNQSESL